MPGVRLIRVLSWILSDFPLAWKRKGNSQEIFFFKNSPAAWLRPSCSSEWSMENLLQVVLENSAHFVSRTHCEQKLFPKSVTVLQKQRTVPAAGDVTTGGGIRKWRWRETVTCTFNHQNNSQRDLGARGFGWTSWFPAVAIAVPVPHTNLECYGMQNSPKCGHRNEPSIRNLNFQPCVKRDYAASATQLELSSERGRNASEDKKRLVRPAVISLKNWLFYLHWWWGFSSIWNIYHLHQ